MTLARSVAAATLTTAMVATLGLAGSGSASAVSEQDYCSGMAAPLPPTHTPNAAPQANDDTAQVVAGSSNVIDVLGNDSDPDGDALAVVNVSSPKRGDVCINGDGTLGYDAAPSSTNYMQTITYAITDGDFYRSAQVTVFVEGVKPMRAHLLHRLTYKKHSHRVKHPAVVGFTNPNKHTMYVLAGNPKKRNPQIARGLGVGYSMSFPTRTKHLVYIIGVLGKDGDISLVNFGSLNTHTGRGSIETLGDSQFRPQTSGWTANKAQVKAWMRAAARH